MGYVFHSNDGITLLFIKLPKLNGISIKSSEEKAKHDSLMGNQKHEKLLNRYLNIWDKIKELLVKEFRCWNNS